jgi:hypothetical protein
MTPQNNRWVLLSVLCLAPALQAQQDRITGRIDTTRTVVLNSTVAPMALAQQGDEGAVEPSRQLPWITLMFSRTPAQEDAFTQLLAEQQDPSSPNYHKWLSSEEFADRFGLSQNDIDKISGWLRDQGFQVAYVARGRDFVAASGTAGQVLNTFHTEIHRYTIDGEAHIMNASAPSVPAALGGVVTEIQGLNDFRAKPGAVRAKPATGAADRPDNTASNGGHSLAPDDIATIYDITRLYNNGVDGSGQKIVVVGQSNINLNDIRQFSSQFNLPGGDPAVMQCCGADPGETEDDNEVEADLDLEWVSGVARKANVIFVYAWDADWAAQYAIDQNLAPVVSESFGVCESSSNKAFSLSAYEQLALNARSKGITWLAAAGDSGAADCDHSSYDAATQGLAVNVPASIPEVTAVGGTEFNEGSGSYWNATNTANGASAQSYIPETAWDDALSYGDHILATGGGRSTFYQKPAWQAGYPGVPSDGMRDVPDVALAASLDHDPYNIYGYDTTTGTSDAYVVGGTSAATPVMAGIVALLNQSLTEAGKPTAGSMNTTLYALARTGSTTNHTSATLFNDVTTGSNRVPCVAGTPDCANGFLGYPAGPGFDLATGLGSVDAYNLVTNWNGGGLAATATTTTVTANPQSLQVSGSTQLTATVSPASGSATPTGSVVFTLGGATLGTAALSGSTASLTVNGSQLSAGSNSIIGTYGGDASFSGSAGSVTVTVTGSVNPPPGALTANPNPIVSASGAGMTTLTWNAPGHSQLAICVGSPNGAQMASGLGPSGSLPTGNWVTNGMQFFLVDFAQNSTIGSVTVQVADGTTPPAPPTPPTPPSPAITLSANPNPIVSARGVGTTTLTWNAPGHSSVAIYINSVSGQPMTGALGSSGSVSTGNWVTNGMQFVLVDLNTASAIASLTVQVNSGGGPPAGAPASILIVSGNQQTGTTNQAFPAPLVIQVVDAQGNPVSGAPVTWAVSQGSATLNNVSTSTNASGQASAAVTAGGSAGPLVISASSGAATAPFTLAVNGYTYTYFNGLAASSGQNVTNGRDNSYQIVADTTGQLVAPAPAFVVTSLAGGWDAIPGAVWIGPSADQSNATRDGCCANTSDTYQTAFTISGSTSGVALNLTVSADDYVDVLLNGNSVFSHPNAAMWSTPVSFSINSGFVSGKNTLDFVVTNVSGPTGLIVAIR